jgi:hypothetical protein
MGLVSPECIPVMIYLSYPGGNGNAESLCIKYVYKLMVN